MMTTPRSAPTATARPWPGFERTLAFPAGLGLWTPSNTLSSDMGYLVGGLLISVALLLFYLHRKHNKPDTQSNPLENATNIDKVFERANDKRAKFAVVCGRQSVTSRHLLGYYRPQEKKTVLLELAAPEGLEEWKEAPVDVYFRLEEDGTQTFYHFSTFVQKIEHKGQTWYIHLAKPSALTNNQRREFVRIAPGVGMMEAVTAWPLSPGPLLTLPSTGKELGRPPFAHRPPATDTLTLMDISASGVRLRLPVEQVRASQARCAPGSRYIMLLAVDALRSDGSRQVMWLSAAVRRAAVLPSKTHVEVGLQFSHWCAVENLSNPIEWKPVEADGEVPFLLRWVGRANILLTRLTD